MSVYGGNTLRELERAVQSGTIEQTLPPAQLVIVRDGPVPDDIQRYLDSLPSTMAVWFAVEHPDRPARSVSVVAGGGLAADPFRHDHPAIRRVVAHGVACTGGRLGQCGCAGQCDPRIQR